MSISEKTIRFLFLLYEAYQSRLSLGVPFGEAVYFGDDAQICEELMPSLPVPLCTHYCWVLRDAGFLSVMPGDDHANHVTLLESGIAECERIDKERSISSQIKRIANDLSFLKL